MSDDNFKKLDSFMNRNVPQMSKTIGSRKVAVQKKIGLLEYVFALGLSCIIGYTVIEHENRKLEHAGVISEVIEWDLSADYDADVVASLEDFEI